MTMQPSRHRPDIDGIRAIAVLAVVAFHVRIPMFEAGFVGVDVFFVLSGFLITGILAREADERGSIRLARFYTRRLRRLLPASTLTVVATMIAAATLLSALSWKLIAETSVAAALYASNLFFARESSDYFAADVQNNPLLHFWSLAVEEQFYIVWPLLVLVLSRFKPNVRTAGIAAVGLASLAHSVMLTNAASSWAYYSPLSRAWEFAAGGLVALLLPAGIVSASARVREVIAWSGLALIGGSVVIISERTAFPGIAAIPTVVGTCMLIAAGVGATSPLGRLLRLWPTQELGRLSYSWYLWHWPFLVIGQIYLDDFGPTTRIMLAAVSLVVAAAAHYLIENPVRFANSLVTSHGPNWAMAIALIAVVLGGSFALTRSADAELATPDYADLVVAQDDEPFLLGRGCNVADVEFLLAECSTGPAGATRTILVLGDSHAEMWTPMLSALADELDYRVVMYALGGCNVAGLEPQISVSFCREVQSNNLAVVDALAPDAVVISHFADNIDNLTASEWSAGIDVILTELTDRDIPVGWIHDSPNLGLNPVECVATKDEDACTPRRSDVVARPDRLRIAETPVLERLGISAFNPIDLLCDENICPLRSDGLFRYRDEHHVAASYAEFLAPAFEPWVTELLNKP